MPRHHNKHVCSKADILCEEEIQSRKHQTTLQPAWQFQPDTLFVHICAHQPIAMLLLSYCCVLRECVLQHFTDLKRAAVVLWRYDQLPAHSHEKLTAKGLNIHTILTHILHGSIPWETYCCRVSSKNVNIDSLHTHMPQTTLFTNLQTLKFLKYKCSSYSQVGISICGPEQGLSFMYAGGCVVGSMCIVMVMVMWYVW